MPLKDKIQEYIILVKNNPEAPEKAVLGKIMQEEEKYTRKQVNDFIKRIKKATNLDLDASFLWNEIRNK